MKRNATKNDVLIGLGELEKLAGRYEATAITLRKLAKGLRSVTNGFGGVEVPQKPSEGRKAAKQAKAGPQKRKPMSAIVRKRLSEAMKARWEAKRATNQKPKLARRANDEPVGNAQQGRVA